VVEEDVVGPIDADVVDVVVAGATCDHDGGHAVELSADSSCSVFWLLAEDGGAELGAVSGAVTERTGLVPWGSRGAGRGRRRSSR
jgi:hypothetical protein